MKHFFKEQLFPVIMIIVGAACAAFSIECFLIPNTILDGGVTGVSMMTNYLTGIRLSILVIVIISKQFLDLTLCNSANGGKACIYGLFRHLLYGRTIRI